MESNYGVRKFRISIRPEQTVYTQIRQHRLRLLITINAICLSSCSLDTADPDQTPSAHDLVLSDYHLFHKLKQKLRSVEKGTAMIMNLLISFRLGVGVKIQTSIEVIFFFFFWFISIPYTYKIH